MTNLFRTLVAVLVVCRFYAFRTELDHPHLWRQADTAFYSLGFYRFGMNIFTPSVAWMGSYRHVILEFPLTEWIAACVYILSGPTILVDRLVNFAFFLGSAFYLFRIVRLVSDDTLARIATLLYMAAPLGIYYSRAAHIDFTAVCFSHALLYYTMRVVVSGRRRDLALAIGAGTLAFVIKSPYAFYLIVPALTFCYLRRADRERWLETLAAFAIPALAFCGWFAYVQSVNRQAPDLSFIPSYHTHVDRFRWYLGTMADRWRLEPWLNVTGRVFREIAVTVWWVLVPFGRAHPPPGGGLLRVRAGVDGGHARVPGALPHAQRPCTTTIRFPSSPRSACCWRFRSTPAGRSRARERARAGPSRRPCSCATWARRCSSRHGASMKPIQWPRRPDDSSRRLPPTPISS